MGQSHYAFSESLAPRFASIFPEALLPVAKWPEGTSVPSST